MALITPTDVEGLGAGIADLTGALAAATETANTVLNDNQIVLVVQNSSAGNRILTVKSKDDPFGRKEDLVLTIPAGKIGVTGFLPQVLFGGTVEFTLDAIATTNIGALRLKKRQ